MKLRPKTAILLLASVLWSGTAAALGTLDNPQPGAVASGISAISGWHCEASRIDIQFDGNLTFSAGARTNRPDTQSTCGRSDTGYSLLLNWNNLGSGTHTVLALADGIEFARATFTVTTLGAEFLTGKTGSARLDNFPDAGKGVLLQWQQSLQNFAIVQAFNGAPSLSDVWYGSDLENRSNCTFPQNNGARGTYSTYNIREGSGSISIVQFGVTGLSCTYSGAYSQSGNLRQASGSFSCSDGKQGSWSANDFTVTDNTMLIKYSSQLTGSESCSIAGLFSGARL
jgi:hypothetical protein